MNLQLSAGKRISIPSIATDIQYANNYFSHKQ
jgi:hypothetical protein